MAEPLYTTVTTMALPIVMELDLSSEEGSTLFAEILSHGDDAAQLCFSVFLAGLLDQSHDGGFIRFTPYTDGAMSPEDFHENMARAYETGRMLAEQDPDA